MNDQNPNPNPNPGTSAPVYRDWHEQRRAERWARREARWQRHGWRHTGWFAGALLILVGGILLLEQMNIPFFANWWVLFILIPAFWAFVAAWDNYQDASRLTRRAAISLIVGILLTILALIFLFNIAVGLLWPILLMLGGLILLGTALLPE
jgi:cation transport ATPase